MVPALPNAPPTNGEITRTWSAGTPSASAYVFCAPLMLCTLSHTVSRSPSQLATVAGISIGLWLLRMIE